MHLRQDQKGAANVILVLALIALCVLIFYSMHDRVTKLENRLEVFDFVRTGIPVEYLDSSDLKPYRKLKIDYEDRPAELRIYRSSGSSPITSKDFIVIVDSLGIVVSAFSITSETPHHQLLRRLGVDLSDRSGIVN